MYYINKPRQGFTEREKEENKGKANDRELN